MSLLLLGVGSPGASGPPPIIQTNLLADYQLAGQSGTTVIDATGNFNAPFTGANPTWVPTGMNFDLDGNFVPTGIPTSEVQTLYILTTLAAVISTGYRSLVGNDNPVATTGINYGWFHNGYQTPISLPSLIPMIYVSGDNDYTYDFPILNTAVLLVYTTGSPDAFWLNNGGAQFAQVGYSSLGSSGRTGNLTLGASPAFTGFGVTTPDAVLHRVAAYSVQHTQAQVQTNYAAISAWAMTKSIPAIGVNPSTARVLTLIGDSITVGFNASSYAASWAGLMPSLLNNTYVIYNLGVFGWTSAQAQQYTLPQADMQYAPNGAKNVAVVFIGTNSLAAGQTPAVVFGILQAIVSNLTATGYDIVIVPCLNRNNAGAGSVYDQYNTLIEGASWGANVSAIPLASFPNLVPDGSSSNTTWFNADQTHPTDAGYSQLANGISNNGIAAFINAFG